MRTSVPQFSFVSSPETEKERLLYATANVASGFYTRHGYLVTSKVVKGYENWCVVMPSVIKGVDQKYWEDACQGGVLMPKVISKYMHDQTKEINLLPVESEKVENVKKEWLKYQTRFWDELLKFFPNEAKWIGFVEVRITKIGSRSSHYLLSKKVGQKLVINIREDSPIFEIANLIILSLIYPLESELGLSFTHRQTLRNFIMTRKEFKKIFPDFKPKIYENIKIPIKFRKESDEYIKILGVPNIVDPIKEINENIDRFGAKESLLLKQLISKHGEILTYDDIADLIWGQGRFKSYWAINKIVQRINRKIKELNIIFEIKGVRGKGYILK